MLKDGINSVSRYYINNFHDDVRQNSIDMFLGKFSKRTAYYSSLSIQQQSAIETSISYLTEQTISTEVDDPIVTSFFIKTVNDGIEKDRVLGDRVLILSTKVFYIIISSFSFLPSFSFNLNTYFFKGWHVFLVDNGRVVSSVDYLFDNLISLFQGPLKEFNQKYAIALYVSSENAKSKLHIYCPFDFSKNQTDEMRDVIVDLFEVIFHSIFPLDSSFIFHFLNFSLLFFSLSLV